MKWRLLPTILIALPLAIVGYLAYLNYSPHLLLNPIARHLYPLRDQPRGTPVKLIPEAFSAGDPREDVVRKIKEAGFRPWPDAGEEEDEETYLLAAGGNIACAFEMYVTVVFDSSDLLTFADGQFLWTCL